MPIRPINPENQTVGSDISLNDNQRREIRRYFSQYRSKLRQYSFLGTGQNTSFDYSPASVNAVRPSNVALIPMVIELVPPDTLIDSDLVLAPTEVEVDGIRLGGFRSSQVSFQDEADEELTFTPDDADEALSSRPVFSGGVSNPDPEDFLRNNAISTRLRGEAIRQADKELQRRNRPIRSDKPEVRDTVGEQERDVVNARDPRAPAEFLKRQIEVMRDLPPLVMYINPSEFSVSYSHIIDDGNKTRDGYTIEHWGLDQPSISASGLIGATYIDKQGANGRRAGGITRSLRKGSAAFQHFMSLFKTYRNNAYIYNQDETLSMVGAVRIVYDDRIYTGSFNSFSIKENDSSPYTLEYDFDFTVRFETRIDPFRGTITSSNFVEDTMDFTPEDSDEIFGGEELTFSPEDADEIFGEEEELTFSPDEADEIFGEDA